MRTITAIMGDGIGPEVMEAAMSVVDATGVQIRWERVLAGMTALTEKGKPLPQETLDSISKNRVALKGPCDTPIGGGFASVNVALRKKFELYANIRPVKSMPGVKGRYSDVDLVVCRENIEDIYCGEEVYMSPIGDSLKFVGGVNYIDRPAGAVVTGVITDKNTRKFFAKILDYAIQHRRKKLTIVHKANILKKTQGLFLEIGTSMAEKYSTMDIEDKIVDNMTMQLVLNPSRFDMIAATNMFGDILSDLCAGLVGGLGLAPGANLGDDCAIFEAVHGTAPDIAGKNLANPTALILSAAMMLDYLGELKAATVIRCAVNEVMFSGEKVTKDINRTNGVSTIEMTDAIVEQIKRRA